MSTNMDKPAIQSITQSQQVNPTTKQPEPYMVVTFKVGNHGPFVESFPKAGFDPAQVNARLADFASKLGLVQGQ
jgi:hypothetical protein